MPSVAIAGIGNISKGDDGVGPYIADKLKNKGVNGVFNCGVCPENYLLKICNLKPELVIFIDAVSMKKKAGTVSLFSAKEVSQGITTHNAGLNILASFIEKECSAKVVVIGIEPQTLKGGLSQAVKSAADKLVDNFGGFLKEALLSLENKTKK